MKRYSLLGARAVLMERAQQFILKVTDAQGRKKVMTMKASEHGDNKKWVKIINNLGIELAKGKRSKLKVSFYSSPSESESVKSREVEIGKDSPETEALSEVQSLKLTGDMPKTKLVVTAEKPVNPQSPSQQTEGKWLKEYVAKQNEETKKHIYPDIPKISAVKAHKGEDKEESKASPIIKDTSQDQLFLLESVSELDINRIETKSKALREKFKNEKSCNEDELSPKTMPLKQTPVLDLPTNSTTNICKINDVNFSYKSEVDSSLKERQFKPHQNSEKIQNVTEKHKIYLDKDLHKSCEDLNDKNQLVTKLKYENGGEETAWNLDICGEYLEKSNQTDDSSTNSTCFDQETKRPLWKIVNRELAEEDLKIPEVYCSENLIQKKLKDSKPGAKHRANVNEIKEKAISSEEYSHKFEQQFNNEMDYLASIEDSLLQTEQNIQQLEDIFDALSSVSSEGT